MDEWRQTPVVNIHSEPWHQLGNGRMNRDKQQQITHTQNNDIN